MPCRRSPCSISATSVALLLFAAAAGCDQSHLAAVSLPAGEKRPAGDAPLPDDAQLRATIDRVLEFTKNNRVLRSDQHAAWQIMHGVLAYGQQFEIDHGDERVAAVDWVLRGGNLNGWVMRRGEVGLQAIMEPGTKTGQGHPDQWLAIVSQCDLPSSQAVIVGDERYTLGDMVKQAMFEVYEGKECSWTLIGLSAYLPLDEAWTARDGTTWTIERVIRMEANQDINASACGGSHRLIGMTMALDRFRRAHGDTELSGGWKAAQERVDWAIDIARRFQQPSGAFSVNYFSRPGNSVDMAAHLGATGHTLEFLALALDRQQLSEPWVERGVVHLCELFDKTAQLDLECGALYHAAHGLALYRQRRFGPAEAGDAPPAESPTEEAPSSN